MNSFKILAAALALAFTSPAFASDVKSPIIGAWRMTALEVGAAGNRQTIPYSGQLVFTQGGTLSVQAMNPDANAADTPYTTKAYEAYYGPVEIDDARNIFAITVEPLWSAT
ncbi:lipocalin-like domain-containing protein [Rhizobium leguminosarum]|uniref:lipocalin-like domain-containing protein n=1 Tax=Rhizobium leguminosarum TaxID=384 RepID=UPI001FEF55B1|nr:lipocalin-like domain-containing protein [Rhizobium leguminosarum]